MGSTSDIFFSHLIDLRNEGTLACKHPGTIEEFMCTLFSFFLLLPSDENDSETVGLQTLASDEKEARVDQTRI
jgi:hypothetical protein